MLLYLSMPHGTRVDGQPIAAYKSQVMPGDKYWIIVFLASNASDGLMTILTPFSSDQMIRNLSMKIGEVDLGSARFSCLNF